METIEFFYQGKETYFTWKKLNGDPSRVIHCQHPVFLSTFNKGHTITCNSLMVLFEDGIKINPEFFTAMKEAFMARNIAKKDS